MSQTFFAPSVTRPQTGQPATQSGFTYPEPLTEKYRPRKIGSFVGLEKSRRILAKFAANPYPASWLFVGRPAPARPRWAWRWPRSYAPKSTIFRLNNARLTLSTIRYAGAGTCHKRARFILCW